MKSEVCCGWCSQDIKLCPPERRMTAKMINKCPGFSHLQTTPAHEKHLTQKYKLTGQKDGA